MNKNLKKILSLAVVVLLLLAGRAGILPLTEQTDTSPAQTTAVQKSTEQPTELPTQAAQTPTEAPTQPEKTQETAQEAEENGLTVEKDGEYSSKDEVALYIHQYGSLPKNYITKQKAQNLGWVSNQGNLWEVAPGKSIGGDRFGNYEGLLPDASGRKYYECDIDFDGKYRNAKRIIFSSDGLIFYTEDHYKTFTQLYGEE